MNTYPSNHEPRSDNQEQEFVLIPIEDFQKMFEDVVNLSDMIDFLVERYRGYERLVIFQAAIHNDPLILFPDTDMISDLETQANSIADRWSDIDIIPINQ